MEKLYQKKILDNLKVKVGNLSKQPHLVVILVGNNPASQIYVKNKKLAAENIGIKSTIIELDSQIKETELLNKIEQLNNDSDVTGILVQLPLPVHIDKIRLLRLFHLKRCRWIYSGECWQTSDRS